MNHYLGIDLGGTNIAAGAVSETGRLLGRCVLPTDGQRSPDAVIEDMARAAECAEAQAGLPRGSCAGVGVGIPGTADASGRTVLFLPNLPWRSVPLAAALEQRLGLPVFLGNDADCAALGEFTAGSAARCSSLLMITLGTGLGGGLIQNGRIFSGFHGEGFEPGHVPFQYGGAQCGCGKLGCLEAYLSASALIRETRSAMRAHTESLLWQFAPTPEQVTAKVSFDAARQGDKTALAVLEQYTDWMAAGLGGLVNLLRPEAVALGGGVAQQGEYLLAMLREKFLRACYATSWIQPPALLCAELGSDAGVIGAGLLAHRDQICNAQGGHLF